MPRNKVLFLKNAIQRCIIWVKKQWTGGAQAEKLFRKAWLFVRVFLLLPSLNRIFT